MTIEKQSENKNSDNLTSAKESFSIEVERLSLEKEITLLQAITELATHYGILDKINSYVSRPLKEKLEIEAIGNRLLKVNKLPVSLFDMP